MPNCWICGELADSAEHKIKKSDIVKINGTGSSKKGEVLLQQGDSLLPLQGSNSKLVKYDKILCSSCNNGFTQPFDKAHECFFANA
jgi:5-methylcytosine-specific restriction endonuclease McrA